MSTFHVDLHVHTSASPDGRPSLEEIARAARRAGLDVRSPPGLATLRGFFWIGRCRWRRWGVCRNRRRR